MGLVWIFFLFVSVCVETPIEGCVKYNQDDPGLCQLCECGKYPNSQNTGCDSKLIQMVHES